MIWIIAYLYVCGILCMCMLHREHFDEYGKDVSFRTVVVVVFYPVFVPLGFIRAIFK